MNRVYDIYSTQSQSEILERLKVKTIRQPKFKYLRWVKTARKDYYYGVLDGYHFKLSPCIPGRNFFTPVLEGEILPWHDGCILHYSVRLSPDMKLCYAMLGMMFCFYGIAYLGVLTGAFVLYGNNSLFDLLFFPLGLIWLFAGFSVLNHFSVKKIEKAIWKDFSTLAA